jgi:hypothetical protein
LAAIVTRPEEEARPQSKQTLNQGFTRRKGKPESKLGLNEDYG